MLSNSLINQGASCTLDSARFVTTMLHQLAESLGAAIDAKDHTTSMHSEEVAQVSHILALGIGMTPREADIIHVAGHLHDIGKIGVPDAILQKEGPLTDDEWAAVRRHPAMGAEILAPVDCLSDFGIVDMVLHHHERFDGKGYPLGLAGEFIPLGCRIIALADSLSAMLQDRPYRDAMSFDDAVRDIVLNSGTQFDPAVVKVFLELAETIRGTMEALSGLSCAA